MEHTAPSEMVDGQDYAVLRQSGTQARRAQAELGLTPETGERLERLFRARAARGDSQVPKFARHDRHVAAVMAQGGFWALSERRIGGDGIVVCLPMIPPAR
jgi:hypothetical protein